MCILGCYGCTQLQNQVASNDGQGCLALSCLVLLVNVLHCKIFKVSQDVSDRSTERSAPMRPKGQLCWRQDTIALQGLGCKRRRQDIIALQEGRGKDAKQRGCMKQIRIRSVHKGGTQQTPDALMERL
eukprot:1159291-Pelagomonas_calceolata.AAC.5